MLAELCCDMSFECGPGNRIVKTALHASGLGSTVYKARTHVICRSSKAVICAGHALQSWLNGKEPEMQIFVDEQLTNI